LKGILEHIQKDHTMNPLHPSHMTEDEREIQRLRKKLKKLKCPKAIERTALMIESITERSRGTIEHP
jgi:hypothetical protein